MSWSEVKEVIHLLGSGQGGGAVITRPNERIDFSLEPLLESTAMEVRPPTFPPPTPFKEAGEKG